MVAQLWLAEIRAAVQRMQQVKYNVDIDNENLKICIKEMATVCEAMFDTIGKAFEQEPVRILSTITLVGGFAGGQHKSTKGVIEYKVIQNRKAVNGDNSLFRQWHQKFTTATGQVKNVHEEIVHRLANEINLGQDLDKNCFGLES